MTTTKHGNIVITDFEDQVKKAGAEEMIQVQAATAQMKIFDIQSRTNAALCECLGMNAENCIAVCDSSIPPYPNSSFIAVLRKWELIDEKGNPTI